MESLNFYPKPLVARRINLALDDLERLAKLLDNIGINLPLEVDNCIENIYIALDLKDDESDTWGFYPKGSRSSLNKKPLNN
jgi:hypothetical protein